MKKYFTIIMITVFMAVGLNAQGMPEKRFDDRKNNENCISDQPYYQYMVFRMTETLELTAEQAEKLFPLNRVYRNDTHILHMKKSALSDEVYQKKEITQADLDKYKDEISRLKKEEAKLDEDFIKDVEKFLEPQQVAKLMFFEPRFRRELSHELKQRYMPKPEEKKGRKIFGNKRK